MIGREVVYGKEERYIRTLKNERFDKVSTGTIIDDANNFIWFCHN